MPHILLLDTDAHTKLLPLTFARPVGELRCGILTIAEKYRRYFPDSQVQCLGPDYLRECFPVKAPGDSVLVVAANLLPEPALVAAIRDLTRGSRLQADGRFVAAHIERESAAELISGGELPRSDSPSELSKSPNFLDRPADIFRHNDAAVREDFRLLTQGRTSQPVSDTNTIIGPADQVFLEEGATIEASTINCSTGPVYLGEDAHILEGCLVRGPLGACAGAVLKMGAKVYGATTLGPSCKVGGEVNNVVFQARSNKGHEGFLGNGVIGEWCNIGADTNASNLKNDYGNVKVWDYATESIALTGLQFHGLIMGDHSKTGINTMLNTGTVVGFSANIFGAGFPPKFIPSFSWGGADGTFVEYRTDKAMATATRMMRRRGVEFGEKEERLFHHLRDLTVRFRP